ncbi:N-acetylmuramoyl-L-alanine amidase [Peribacillus kribbensis]|uniref:N-acetylmuramoyl-L-alanine amidase n=1 Tax=Peribacillus kribbensis TaxID=356658 RepID=UPI0003FE029A|nr:N-acetylmuramoyl-L-alanine amidase [Peribacillus kribbensis]
MRRTLLRILLILLFIPLSAALGHASADDKTIKVQVNQLNIREGPSLTSAVAGKAYYGEEYKVLKEKGDWIQIDFGGRKGWAAGWLVQTTEAVRTDESPTALVTADSLRVRNGPGEQFQVIGTLDQGETASVLEQNESWVKLQTKNLSGWVSADFIQLSGKSAPAPEKKNPSEGTNMGEVRASASLFVRAEPSLNGKIIGEITEDGFYTIIKEEKQWIYLEYKKGKKGWAPRWFLERSSSEKKTAQEAPAEGSKIKILYEGTSLRSQADVNSKIVKRAEKGKVYKVQAAAGSWYKVMDGNQNLYIAGWMASNLNGTPQIAEPGPQEYLKDRLIIIDPGHGGEDRGTTGALGTLEKNLTLRTALLLYNKLDAAGARPILTRSHDTYISLQTRTAAANSRYGATFLSIHYDSSQQNDVQGFTAYYFHGYQKALAECLEEAMAQNLMLSSRGARQGNYHVLRENKSSAALMELGYLSSPNEEQVLRSRKFQEKAASALYKGLAEYFKRMD